MRPLLEDIRTSSANTPPDLIVFSGDLVYGEVNAVEMGTQFEEARQWLDEIHHIWGISLGDLPLLLVPGNHDIQRSKVDETQTPWLHSQQTDESIERIIKKQSTTWKNFLSRQTQWWHFIRSIQRQSWNYDENLHISSGRFSFAGKTIGIVGFNSSWSSSENMEKGKLWFTRHQLQVGAQLVEGTDFRIAVLHHPISWFHPSEEAWLAQKFASSFHLTLNGHLHSSWYTHSESDQHVNVSAGACWAGSKEENGYSWIGIDPISPLVELHARAYQDKGKGTWIPAHVPTKFDLNGSVRLPLTPAKQPAANEATDLSATSHTHIAGTTDIATTFPALPDPWIDRSEQIAHLQESFDSTTHVVLLTGQEGVGKTLLAAKLAQESPLTSISIFLEPIPHWATQFAKARYDLFNQVNWIITGQEIAYDTVVSESLLAVALHKLHRNSRARGKAVYVIIDGFNQVKSQQATGAITDILTLLEPFLNTFRFVITLNPELLPESYRSIAYRTFPVPRFDRSQCEKYLAGVTASASIDEIWHLTRGHPAALASIRRILKKSPDTTLDRLSASLPELFSCEWSQVDEDNSNQLLLLAAIALFPQKFTIETLVRILGIPKPEIDYAVQNLQFLAISPNTLQVDFLSDPLRAFAARRLKRFEHSIRDSIIEDLMKQPHDYESLHQVPLYLSDSGRGDELLEYLSPEHLSKLLQDSQSWQEAIAKTELALSVALKTEKIREYSRFALHKSSLFQFQSSGSSTSTVEALMALGRTSDALEFAEAQATKEHRLLLLAVVARAAREKKLLLPSTVAESIQRMASDLPKTVDEEQRLQIATELIHVYPEIAIKLVETLSGRADDIDSSLVAVSVRALSRRKSETLLEDSLENITTKIGSETVRKFTTAAQVIFGDSSAAAALTRIKGLASPKDQIYLLRQWAESHSRAADGRPLIEYALDMIVKTTEYTPNASVLRRLAEPLPFLEKNYAVSVLVSRFSDQVKLLHSKGFTEDYVRLQLTLSLTEASYAESQFKSRLENLFFYVMEIEDLSIRLSCIALMCSKVADIALVFDCQENSALSTSLMQELRSQFDRLLTTTADHYTAARRTIMNVHGVDAPLALELASQLNTEPRRNQAYADLLRLELRNDAPNVAFALQLQGLITYNELFESVMVKALFGLSKPLSRKVAPELVEALIRIVRGFSDTVKRVAAITRLLVITKACPEVHIDALKPELYTSWQLIDDAGVRREAGLEIVIALADTFPEEAALYWDRVNDLSAQSGITEEHSATILYHNILLGVRLFKGLIPRNLASTADKHALLNQIEKLPSLAKRAHLLSVLSLGYFRHSKLSEGNAIVQDYIVPLLEQMAQKDRSLYEKTFVEVAPAMYLSHGPTTRQRLLTFEPYRRDEALEAMCSYLKKKVAPGDPYSMDDRKDLKLHFHELTELAGLLELAEDDSFVCWTIEHIASTVASSRGKRSYSLQQQTDLAAQLNKLIKDKLPNSRFVRHDGYAIVARSEVSRFSGLREDEYDALVSSARALTNVADQCFVMAHVALSSMGTRVTSSRQLIREAVEGVGSITTFEDRVERYEVLSRIAADIDKGVAKDALRRALDYIGSVESWRSGSHARRIVDAAGKLDQQLGEEFASKLDTDPARAEYRKIGRIREDEADLRKKICSNDTLEGVILDGDDVLSEVIVKLWGDINAGSVPPLKHARCRELIRLASRVQFRDAYLTWSFVVENMVSLYANTDQAETFLRPFFDAVLINGELTMRIARSTTFDGGRNSTTSFEEFYSGVTTIPAGSRQRAIEEIEQWCIEAVDDYLIVIDPFFQQHDLTLVELVRRVGSQCHVTVLTSKGVQSLDSGTASVEESYKKAWRSLAGAGDPGSVEIILVGAGFTGELPMSERYLLASKGGLLLGAPYSNLGVARQSQIRRLSAEAAGQVESDIQVFVDGRLAGQYQLPLSITRFTLR